MNNSYKHAILNTIMGHSGIQCAAVTGSVASERGADLHSDLDLLLVTNDIESVRDVRSWLPESERVAITAFHLMHYCSVLMDDMFKVDLAIYSVEVPTSEWLLQDFTMIKGGANFELALNAAREATNSIRVAHVDPDVSVDNILLLLSTAAKRNVRGEELSAHALVAMAADMLVCLETQNSLMPDSVDYLDPRRRLETNRPALATSIKAALFINPGDGIIRLAEHVLREFRSTMSATQLRVAEQLTSL